MNNNIAVIVAIVLVIISLGGLVWWNISKGKDVPLVNATSTTPTTTPTGSSGATSTPTTPSMVGSVSIALLDIEGTTTGKERGCDRVVMVKESIAPTTAPLTAALTKLFSYESERPLNNSLFNFMARTNDTLKFDHATVQDGVARIYLTGALSGLAGVCDDPRAQIQIEETALQFPTVTRVQLYLNGQQTTLTPSQR